MGKTTTIRWRKINTPERFAAAQDALGCNNEEMAVALRLPKGHGRETIRRYRTGTNTRGIPGGTQIAMEAFMAGYRPVGVRLPCDKAGK